MARKKLAAAVLSLGCLSATSVYGLGLGELTLESFLNEPFKAKVDLLNVGGLIDDQIRIRLATSEDFDRMGVDRAYFLTGLQFEVTVDDDGKGFITVTSDDPVLEPYLDFIVEARWPSGRLLREYTVLVDPPTFAPESAVVSASQRVAETEGLPAPDAEKKSAAAQSGTRVDVRQSDLAPGEMPRREYWSETADAPVPGSRYMIRRDENLWGIASRARPEGVSVQQTMLEIQRLNPDAFLDGNINRIKAGYIIYLPGSGDISATDEAAVLAEVKEQNQEWREGRSSLERRGLGAPALRISADPVQDADGSDGASSASPGGDMMADGGIDESAAMAPMPADGESGERLAAMEERVETLQRIVDLKDEQIAALQNALAEAQAGGAPDADSSDLAAEDSSVDELLPMLEAEDVADAGMEEPVADTSEPPAEEVVEAAPAAAPQPVQVTPAPKQEESGLLSMVLYGLGALVLALLGLFLWRRRSSEDEDASTDRADDADIFAGVELSDQDVEVARNGDTPPAAVDPTPVVEKEPEPQPEALQADNRGYGEHKHDEYADDVDAGDALAEAEIYIAYGRYPQARELLRNAVASEPDNPAYHLKLMEIASETGDLDGMKAQYAELERIGDAASLAEAGALMGDDQSGGSSDPLGDLDLGSDGELDMQPPEDLASTELDSLDADFAGLEIEATGELEEELDLSADFEKPAGNGEELVIAAEGNEMSTKLDLARAYLDMGDDDGARQILEEVMAEGSDDQQQEAKGLLDRIG